MKPPRNNRFACGLMALLLIGCGSPSNKVDDPAQSEQRASVEGKVADTRPLGLMTSLPLYWPLGAGFVDLANGAVEKPWQRLVLERRHALVPLDTLSPIAPLNPGDPDIDPLADLTHLAVIQPRGLSPADNVALDEWVRAGGRLLLVLDPTLTGEYELPVGDPRRPVDVALIPPVVERWGLQVEFVLHEQWEAGIFEVPFAGGHFTVSHGGQLEIVDPDAGECALHASAVIAQCEIDAGRITLIADAAWLEQSELAGEQGHTLLMLFDFAFQ